MAVLTSGWTSGQIDSLWGDATFAPGGALGLDTTNGNFPYGTNLTNANMGLTKLGNNTLILNGANSYGGGTTVTAGTLQLGNASAIGTGSLTMNGGTLDLHGFGPTVTSLSGSGTITDLRPALDNDPDGKRPVRHFVEPIPE